MRAPFLLTFGTETAKDGFAGFAAGVWYRNGKRWCSGPADGRRMRKRQGMRLRAGRSPGTGMPRKTIVPWPRRKSHRFFLPRPLFFQKGGMRPGGPPVRRRSHGPCRAGSTAPSARSARRARPAR